MTSAGNQRVVIAGGSGFLGRSLAQHLHDAGRRVVMLSRAVPSELGPFEHVQWDGRSLDAWSASIDGCDALVNLAGRTVDCVKTPDHIDEILRSRVESTRVLGEACARAERPPRVWVQMSTAHIYGDPPSARCTEDAALGTGSRRTSGGRGTKPLLAPSPRARGASSSDPASSSVAAAAPSPDSRGSHDSASAGPSGPASRA